MARSAWANIEYSANLIANPPFQSNVGTFRGTKTGWVVGAGAEWMATTNILLRAEYLFYEITDANVSATAPVCSPALGCSIRPFAYTWSNYNVQVARIAASYKF